jgi:hypothetical protein
LNRFGVLVASLFFWFLFVSFDFQDLFRLLHFLPLSVFPFFFTLRLLLSLLFPPLCCACWRPSQTWRLAQLVEHILCVFFRRNRGQKERRYQSASVGSHSALICFFEVSFLSLLLLLCCCVYAVCRSTETNPEDAWGGKRALANDLPG